MPKNQVATQKRFVFRTLLVAVITATVGWGTAAHAQVVKGNGTAGTITVWNSTDTIGNSMVSQSGGNVNVNGGVKASGPVTAPSFSGSFSGNGAGLGNVNASMLGGLGPAGFAQLANSNIFESDQTINGHLTLSDSINNALTLQGNLSDASGDVGANVIGGFGGSSSVPGNSVAKGVLGATIAGGGGNDPNQFGFVPNTVSADWGTVGGGGLNTVGSLFATVAGGHKNTAYAYAATVGGGFINFAEGNASTVSGGSNNQANGNSSAVPGGYNNNAAGDYSFAAGVNATAINTGSFVWGDASGGITTDTGANQFVAQASGGFTFYTAPGAPTGATLPSGSGSWSSLSDRNVKANLMAVDGHAILERLASLPISTWNYKAQADSVRHLGPMAQDFRDAFGLGEDEKHISTVDSEGVALAAIQALYQEKQQEVNQLKDRLATLENRLDRLESSK
jgi:hypothetical protein